MSHTVSQLVSWLVFWAKSTTEDYITAKNNVQSVSYLLCMQVIKAQIIQKPQSVLTQIHIKQNIHKHQTQNFWRISPFSITPVKKHIRLGHAGIVDQSVDLSVPGWYGDTVTHCCRVIWGHSNTSLQGDMGTQYHIAAGWYWDTGTHCCRVIWGHSNTLLQGDMGTQ